MPQPVVSSRYLFLCSPPKIVLYLSPASWATFTNWTPKSTAAVAGLGAGVCPLRRRGRASDNTPSKDNTTAERLRDFKKSRREEDKRRASIGLVLEFATKQL